MAVTGVISETFHKQNEPSQKKTLLKKVLVKYFNEKLFEAPIARQDCNSNHVKKERALLPPLQQVFFLPDFLPDFLTP